MDGSPQVVRFDATTLWHFDAAEWAPSTASFASGPTRSDARGMSALARKRTGANPLDMSALCQKQTFALQHVFLFDHLVGRGQQTRRHFKSERPGRPAGAKGEALVGAAP